jgi:hypothetical protein
MNVLRLETARPKSANVVVKTTLPPAMVKPMDSRVVMAFQRSVYITGCMEEVEVEFDRLNVSITVAEGVVKTERPEFEMELVNANAKKDRQVRSRHCNSEVCTLHDVKTITHSPLVS